MAITITKTSAGRMKIDDTVKQSYHSIPGILTMKADGDDVIMEMINGGDKLKVFRKSFIGIASPAGTTIGACTYDEAGGGVDDEWTKATHGLAVGDSVIFTAVGTGASGYAISTRYYVAAIPTASTFTLSATLGGSAIEGTGDSSGTWTLIHYSAQDTVDVIEALLTL